MLRGRQAQTGGRCTLRPSPPSCSRTFASPRPRAATHARATPNVTVGTGIATTAGDKGAAAAPRAGLPGALRSGGLRRRRRRRRHRRRRHRHRHRQRHRQRRRAQALCSSALLSRSATRTITTPTANGGSAARAETRCNWTLPPSMSRATSTTSTCSTAPPSTPARSWGATLAHRHRPRPSLL